MLCPIRPEIAHSRTDDWQAEWKATYAELVEVLASIEDCLDEIAERRSSTSRLSVYLPDTDCASLSG